jgi:formaldehyde-activating enzyme involved in methanogenesis
MALGWESESAGLQTIGPDAAAIALALRASVEGTLTPQRSLTDRCIVVAVSPNRNNRVRR